MRIVVAGGTGRIGRLLVQQLTRQGHETVSLSRGEGVDLLRGTGLVERLAGADAVVDASSLPATSVAEAEAAFTATTQNLLEAENSAGVRHHIVLSIAALDSVRGNPHYFGKRAQERAALAGSIPSTIVRATQFHDFPAMIAERAVIDGEALVPPLRLQPIAPSDVAATLADVATAPPARGTVVIAGPRTEDAVDMAVRTFAARGIALPVRATWNGAALGPEFAGDVLLPGEGAQLAPTTFDEWLAAGAR